MKFRLKKMRVSPSPSPPAKSIASQKAAQLAFDLQVNRSSAGQPLSKKSSTLRNEALDRIKHEFGRFQAAIDDIRKWGTDRGVDQASDILAATYRLLDLCELHNPEPKKGKAR